jgi:hypothetical protein
MVSFGAAQFNNHVDFQSATFPDHANFKSARFGGKPPSGKR